MHLRSQFLNPRWVVSRGWRRLSGAEAKYWRQELARLQEEQRIELAEKDSSIQELQDLVQELNLQKEARGSRLHPFVSEAMNLVADRLPHDQLKYPTGDENPSELGEYFIAFGSDKETRHSYGETYEELIKSSDALAPRILEIGLGSLNAFAYAGLPPGGSLKAWRTRYPSGVAVGMDIDPESVAAVEQPAFVVDQTSDVSLASASRRLAEFGSFDLIVDDGFHDPHANVRTLLALFKHLKPGGHYVVEDIHESLIDFWRVVGPFLPGDSHVLDLRAQRPECDDNVLFISQAPLS